MKPTELRIGNWIEWDDDSHEQFKVETIDYSEPNYFVNGGLLDDMLPIPLTEEWLLKFGAVKTFDNWQFTISVGAITLHFRRNNEWYSELGGIYLGSKIKYVHQLQNLYFALTGNELELK